MLLWLITIAFIMIAFAQFLHQECCRKYCHSHQIAKETHQEEQRVAQPLIVAWLMAELPFTYGIENGMLVSTEVLQMAQFRLYINCWKNNWEYFSDLQPTLIINSLLYLGYTAQCWVQYSTHLKLTKFSLVQVLLHTLFKLMPSIKVITTTLLYIPRNVGPDHSCLQAA